MISYRVKEKSWIARVAAAKLRAGRVAITIGKTIYLHNVSQHDFLKDERWLRHELCHVNQFKKHGFLPFLARYLWESIRHGYYNNKYEREARRAE